MIYSTIPRIYFYNFVVLGEHCETVCVLSGNRLDISLVIDTSDSQVSNSPFVEELISNIIKRFDTQNSVKISITSFGDYRTGEVDTAMGPVDFATQSDWDYYLNLKLNFDDAFKT